MVAASSTPPRSPPGDPPKSAKPPKPEPRSGIGKVLKSFRRLASLQVRIWLTQAKATALKVGIFAGLFGASALLSILAIIFLYIGVFKLLTDVAHIPVVYAFLIYGGVHILLAIILALIAVKIITRKDVDDEDTETEDAEKPDPSHGPEAP